ncbi:MAG: SRPBCC domain-containing protein [Actinobacteria bacterium]|nr:SRPBCC domain-containing protein [Actinomycetota bacterium]
MDDVTVERSIVVPAPSDVVWEHLVEGTLVSDWMESPVTIEPRVGGKIGFAPDGVEYLGTLEEIEPGRCISWSWRHPDRDPSLVTIRLEPGEEGTMITVTESLLAYSVTDARPRQHPGLPIVYLAA